MKQSGRFRVIVGVCALAAVAVLALVVAGGGGNGANLVSGSAIADAARATERVPGSTVTGIAKIDGPGLKEPLVMRMRGIEDMRGRTARLVGAYSNFPQQVPGRDANGDVPFEMIAVLPDFYVRSPLLRRALPSGKSWIHVDIAKTARKLGISDPTQLGASDPTETLQDLRATSGRVERIGDENVRGVPTTHYRAKVELRRLPASVPPARRAAAKKTADRLIQLTGADSYPTEVWIDRRHLVRRMSFVMHMKIQGGSVTSDVTTEMYDFGPKQKAKPPPADETVDAPQVSRGGLTP
jgi:hypothetical protein